MLVKEKYKSYPAHGCAGYFVIHKWEFHYDDGSVETLTKRTRQKSDRVQKEVQRKN